MLSNDDSDSVNVCCKKIFSPFKASTSNVILANSDSKSVIRSSFSVLLSSPAQPDIKDDKNIRVSRTAIFFIVPLVIETK